MYGIDSDRGRTGSAYGCKQDRRESLVSDTDLYTDDPCYVYITRVCTMVWLFNRDESTGCGTGYFFLDYS